MQNNSFELACKSLNITDQTIDSFHEYIDLLTSWNQKINLVGRQQSLDRIYHFHLLDSLLVVDKLAENKTVIDVGSGAGFPGLCWALALNDLQVTLVERQQKKATFLKEAVKALKLGDRVEVIGMTAEHIKRKADIISCRGLTTVDEFLLITEHLGYAHSRWWLLKGLLDVIETEIGPQTRKNWNIDIIPLRHPTLDVTRHLVEASIRP